MASLEKENETIQLNIRLSLRFYRRWCTAMGRRGTRIATGGIHRQSLIFAECLENWVPVSSLEVLQAHGQAGSSPLSATAADEERVPAPIQQPGKKHRILENRPLSREAVRLRNERGRLRTAEEDRGEVTDFVVDRTSG